jgi:hypothetical protein
MDSVLKTRTGLLLGTPAYIAPEQASRQLVDGRADLYALGVTLYEMITGHYPFPMDDPVKSVILRLTEKPDKPSKWRPDITPELEGIILKALERDKARRYPDAGAMRADLLRFAGDAAPLALRSDMAAPTVSPFAPEADVLAPTHLEMSAAGTTAPRPAGGGRRWLVLAAALLLVVLGTVAVVNFWPAVEESPPVERLLPQPGEAAANQVRGTDGSEPAGAILPADEPEDEPDTEGESGKNVADGTEPPSSGSPGQPPARVRTETAPPPEPLVRRPVQPPRLLEQVPVRLPEEKAALCQSQVINFSLVIGEDGRVKSVKALSAGHPPDCLAAAEEAVRQYVFSPALDVAGEPLEATVAVAVEITGGT